MHRPYRRLWRITLAIALATGLVSVGAAAASTVAPVPLQLRRLPCPLTLDLRVPAGPQPPGLAAPFRLAVGRMFGAGRPALAVLYRSPGAPGHVLSVYRLTPDGPERAGGYELPGLQADGLVLADVTGDGRDEVWLGYAPGIDCLDWDGERLVPLEPWKRWQNKPVAMGRLGGEAGDPAQILALGAWYSPEVGVGLIAGWWRDKMWGKAFDVREDEYFCPGDRIAAADVNGDGLPELLIAASPERQVLPVKPFAVAGLRTATSLAVFPGLYPTAVAVADLDGNGLPEIYVAERLPAGEAGSAVSRVRGFAWNGSGFTEVFRQDYPDRVVDLAAGDLDGQGRPSLLVGLLRTEGDRSCLAIDIWQAAAAVNEVIIGQFALDGPPAPFGWTNFAALDVGDVDGDGLAELVVASPAGSGPAGGSRDLRKASLPTEEQAAPFTVEAFRLAAAGAGPDFRLRLTPLATAGPFDLTVNGLTIADLYPQGPPEIWFAYLPKAGCLEFDGTAFQVKDSWQTWANKPVVLSRYGPVVTGGRGQEKLLALAYRYSPDVAVGLVTVHRPVKCPSKEKDVPGESFFSPMDHFLATDLDGDGQTELLAAYSRCSRQFEPRPFTVTDLWSGRPRLTLPGVLPDELTAGDVDRDGAVEVVLAENESDKDGWPGQAVVKVFRWNGVSLQEIRRFTYPGAWVSDLAYGDVDHNGQGDLAVALLERVGRTSNVVLQAVFPYLGVKD